MMPMSSHRAHTNADVPRTFIVDLLPDCLAGLRQRWEVLDRDSQHTPVEQAQAIGRSATLCTHASCVSSRQESQGLERSRGQEGPTRSLLPIDSACVKGGRL